MKKMLSFGLLLSLILISCQQPEPKEATLDLSEPVFDSIAAKKYGADDYGMRKYVFAFLYRGPNRDRPKEEADKLQAAHMANIGKMAEAGKLVLAGPFFGDGDLRGIYIFDVQTIAEAEALTNTDPAIQAGSLRMELMEWYGSAGLKAVNEIHATLGRKGI
jgi:uncharacterized protein YciI